MITATTWVPRGFAAQFPERAKFDDAEYERIANLARLKLEDAQQDLDDAQEEEDVAMDEDKADGDEEEEMNEDDEDEVNGDKKKKGKSKAKDARSKEEIDDDLKEYDLDNYDNSADEGEGETMGMFGDVKQLAYYDNNAEDPYITIPDNEDDSEREELQVLATDNMLVAGKFEDEWAHLEVYVYEDEADNLYVHHDINLPAIPLCIEWLDMPVGSESKPVSKDASGNFIAVGTTDPDIEIWNLDTVDGIYPDAILGGAEKEKPSKKKKKKLKKKDEVKPNDKYHVSSVLALAANRSHRNLLASGSADTTVKLWDLTTATCAKSYAHHTDKVCALSWHPKDTTVLLSGSWDRMIVVTDMRASAPTGRWGVESDVENVRWDPHDPNYFYVSTESGCLHRHDSRNPPSTLHATKPLWTLQAHSASLTSFDVCSVAPGLIATGSQDKTVKLWDVSQGKPNMLVGRDFDVGKIFSTAFAPDPAVGFRLAVAGSKGVVRVWDTSTNAVVRRAFSDKAAEFISAKDGEEGDKEEKVIGLHDDSESEDDDEEEGAEGSAAAGNGVDGEGSEEENKDGWESMDEE